MLIKKVSIKGNNKARKKKRCIVGSQGIPHWEDDIWTELKKVKTKIILISREEHARQRKPQVQKC